MTVKMRRGTIGGVLAVKKVANTQEHKVINVDWTVAVNIGGAMFWPRKLKENG